MRKIAVLALVLTLSPLALADPDFDLPAVPSAEPSCLLATEDGCVGAQPAAAQECDVDLQPYACFNWPCLPKCMLIGINKHLRHVPDLIAEILA